MKKKDASLLLVKALSASYLNHVRKIKANQSTTKRYSDDEIRVARFCCNRIEETVDKLEDNYRLIIYHEVILGEKGDWYLGYISSSTYYRYRKQAYKMFIERVEEK